MALNAAPENLINRICLALAAIMRSVSAWIGHILLTFSLYGSLLFRFFCHGCAGSGLLVNGYRLLLPCALPPPLRQLALADRDLWRRSAAGERPLVPSRPQRAPLGAF